MITLDVVHTIHTHIHYSLRATAQPPYHIITLHMYKDQPIDLDTASSPHTLWMVTQFTCCALSKTSGSSKWLAMRCKRPMYNSLYNDTHHFIHTLLYITYIIYMNPSSYLSVVTQPFARVTLSTSSGRPGLCGSFISTCMTIHSFVHSHGNFKWRRCSPLLTASPPLHSTAWQSPMLKTVRWLRTMNAPNAVVPHSILLFRHISWGWNYYAGDVINSRAHARQVEVVVVVVVVTDRAHHITEGHKKLPGILGLSPYTFL